VDFEVLWDLTVDLVEELPKLDGPVPEVRLSKNISCRDVKRGERAKGARFGRIER